MLILIKQTINICATFKRRLEIIEYLNLSQDKHESFVDRWWIYGIYLIYFKYGYIFDEL